MSVDARTPELRHDYPTRDAKQPCLTCKQPIQSGQIYLVRGPWHISCGPRIPASGFDGGSVRWVAHRP